MLYQASPSYHRTTARLQGYLAHKKLPPPRTLLGLCIGPYGGPWGGRGFSWARYPCISAIKKRLSYEGGRSSGVNFPLLMTVRELSVGQDHTYRGTSLIRNSAPLGPYSRPGHAYRGTSLIRNSAPLGPYGRICLGSYGGPKGEYCFL